MKKFYSCLSALMAILLWGAFTMVSVSSLAQGVGINPNGAAPDPSAILDVSSQTQGVVLPRVSIAERDLIANPVTGLLIYNTDCNNFDYFNGIEWTPVNTIAADAGITANPAGPVCSGTSITFTATAVNGGNAPAFQWYLNGQPVSGATDATYSSDLLSNGDVLSCVITSNAPCVTGSPATSNLISMVVNSISQASVSITASPSGSICPGESISFTAIPSNGGPIPQYQWKVNGEDVSSTISTFSSSSLNDGDVVTCVMTSNQPCVQNSPATSNSIVVQYGSPPATPGVISGAVNACANSTANIYSINPVSGATSYFWTVPDGSEITAGQGTSSISVNFANTSGDITVTASNSCGTSSASSASITLTGGSGSQTFSYTGSAQTFTVPVCVSELTFEVWGAEGGLPSSGGAAGLGGYATGTYPVTTGMTFQVNVGGKPTNATGGWNGGGNGSTGAGSYGGGGGGASDVRLTSNTDLSGRLIVAGGGGGGGLSNGSPGGNGGGTTGFASGSTLTGGSQDSMGSGGTQSAGGAGGAGYAWVFPQCVTNGNAGSFGQGGNGVFNNGSSCGVYNSGGGGGGWYGGGSGATSGWSGSAPGAGGSGYTGGVSNASMQGGIRSGHGQVIISW